MVQSISDENIKRFRDAIAKYEPYPLSVLNEIGFDDDTFDDNRVYATYALKRLLENGIPIEDNETAPK